MAERHTLANGLRVVLAPDPAVPAVSVALCYGVGARCERPGRAGFSHLFEHLMFRGTRRGGAVAYARQVEELGGGFNGSTFMDTTVYHATVPAQALSRVLELEADRMAGPLIDADGLRAEVGVITQEVASRRNRPYAGFPKLRLRELMFGSFANTHDGLSGLGDLATVTPAEADEFFDRWYAPGNAALCVAGDLPPEAHELVERHFGGIPGRAQPEVRRAEPERDGERRHRATDPTVPAAAVALAWRVPDPLGDPDRFLPFVLLAEVLEQRAAAGLVAAADPLALAVSARVELMGDPFAVADPTGLVVLAHVAPGRDPDAVVDRLGADVERLAAHGATERELTLAAVTVTSRILRNLDHLTTRATQLATVELLRGDASCADGLPAALTRVTSDLLKNAAGTLRADRRTVVEHSP